MKQLKIKNQILLIDDDDFEKVNRFKWTFDASIGYMVRGEWRDDNKTHKIYLHKFIMGEVPEGMRIDHIDRNKLNNQKSNLRICKHNENLFNGKFRGNNTSGHLGVAFNRARSKYEAHIGIENKKIHLGLFKSLKEAVEARKKAELEFYPNFKRTI